MAASHRAETCVFCHPQDARRGAWQRERLSLQPERVSRVQTHGLPWGCAWGILQFLTFVQLPKFFGQDEVFSHKKWEGGHFLN